MRCLLTGGAGFLGRMLAAGLRESGAEVLVADLRELPGFGFQPIDLTRPETLAWRGGRFALLVHAAGLAHTRPRTEAERQRFFEINAGGTARLLDSLAGELRPAMAVLVSTVSVYGRDEGELLDEETPLAAADPYGASKIEAERIFRGWAERHGVRWTILRLPLVWGEDPPGNLGAMIAAMRAGRYFGIGRGEARKSIVWGMDVARVLLRAAREGGLYHLTDGCHPTFREIEEAVAARLGLRPPRRLPRWIGWMTAAAGSMLRHALRLPVPLDLPTYSKMISTLTFSDHRARRCLGWQPWSVAQLIPSGSGNLFKAT